MKKLGKPGNPSWEGIYEQPGCHIDIWNMDKSSFKYFRETNRCSIVSANVPLDAKIVLDIGYGSGYLSWLLTKRKHNVLAIDISFDLLVKARGDLYTEITKIQADAQNLPFAEESIDTVVASEVVEHIPDYMKAYAEMWRVLIPGGTLILTVPNNQEINPIYCPKCGCKFTLGGHLHSFDKIKMACELKSWFNITKILTFGNRFTHRCHKILRRHYPLTSFADKMLSRLFPRWSRFILVVAKKILPS
jgi:ubiquinone/menaquinone biosynthesis C-methylase UbiE